MRCPPSRGAAALCALAALACGEATAPVAPSGPITLSIVSGDAQQGVVGRELAEPIIVKAVDARGLPARGVLNFVVVAGGGSVWAPSVTPHQNTGVARNYWTLGRSLEPGANRIEVRGIDPITGERTVYGVLTATGLPVPVGRVEITAGSDTTVYQHWIEQLRARVFDEEGTLLEGRLINWTSLDPGVANVDPIGHLVPHTLGHARIVASHQGKADTLLVFVDPAPVHSVTIVGPTSVHANYSTQLAAELRDVKGHVLTGRDVKWSLVSSPPGAVPGSMTTGGLFRPADAGPHVVRARVASGAVDGDGWVQATATVTASWRPVASFALTDEPPGGLFPRVVRVQALDDAGVATKRPALTTSTSPIGRITIVQAGGGTTFTLLGILHTEPGPVTVTVAAAGGPTATFEHFVPFPIVGAEPNDTDAAATPLPDVLPDGRSDALGNFHHSDDVADWYRVRVGEPDDREACGRLTPGAPQPYRVIVTRSGTVPPLGKYRLTVHRPDGTTLVGKDATETLDRVTWDFDGSCGVRDVHELRIEVHRGSTQVTGAQYGLSVVVERR